MNIIGICGPSSSGKSTIVERVAKHLDTNILSLDNFFKLGQEKEYVTVEGVKYRSYERPWLYEGDSLAKVIYCLSLDTGRVAYEARPTVIDNENGAYMITPRPYLLVEGFHILNFESLRRQFDKSIYLDLPFAEQIKRRRIRGGRGKSDISYEKIGEQEYENYVLPQREFADYVLDAKLPPEQLEQKVLDIIL